jgi:hypothetical protein
VSLQISFIPIGHGLLRKSRLKLVSSGPVSLSIVHKIADFDWKMLNPPKNGKRNELKGIKLYLYATGGDDVDQSGNDFP